MKFLEYLKEMWNVVTGDLDDIYLYELLTRKAPEKDNYIQWLHSREKEQMQNYIFQEYKLSRFSKEDRAIIHFFKSRLSCGFMLRFPESMLPINFQHLFDNLRFKTEENGYFIVNADRKIFNRKDYEEIIERYQLKSLSFNNNENENNDSETSENIETGNYFDTVCIELFKVDDQPMYIKYTCRNKVENGSAPETFEKLIENICEQELEELKEAEGNHLHNSGNGNLS